MPLLYDILCVNKKATEREIEENYRLLAYRYKLSSSTEQLMEINDAIRILLDPHLRAYYDTFGDGQLSVLNKPVQGYIYSRLFSRFNIGCMLLYALCNYINLAGMYFIFLVFDSYFVRNALIIFSPFFLFLVLINIHVSLSAHRNNIAIFYSCFIQLTIHGCTVLFLTLHLDGVIGLYPALVSVLICDAFAFAFYFVQNRTALMQSTLSVLFWAFKTGFTLLYFVPGFGFKAFIPVFICLAFGIFSSAIGYALAAFITMYATVISMMCRDGPGAFASWIVALLYCMTGMLVMVSVIKHFWASAPTSRTKRAFMVSGVLASTPNI